MSISTNRVSEQETLAFVADTLGVERGLVTRDAMFDRDLGADSLDVVHLIFEVESRFHVSITDEQARNMPKVGDLLNFLEARA